MLQKLVYGRTGEVINNDVNIRGGSEKMNFSFSYADYREKAIMLTSDFKKQNAALKLKYKPNDKVKLDFNLRYSNINVNGGGSNEQDNKGSSGDTRLKHAVTYTPLPITGLTSDATDAEITDYLINPITSVNDNDREQYKKRYN